jgi:hypothetical protein
MGHLPFRRKPFKIALPWAIFSITVPLVPVISSKLIVSNPSVNPTEAIIRAYGKLFARFQLKVISGI